MNKLKKVPCEKTLVRNCREAKPKTEVISEIEKKTKVQVKHDDCKDQKRDPPKKTRDTNENTGNFEAPEPNTLLQMAKQIKSLEVINARKVKTDLHARKAKLALEEKASKTLNFPQDYKLYKDLIPLCVRTDTLPVTTKIREPVSQKDVVPSLEDFYVKKTLPEYKYQVPVITNHNHLTRQHDGLKLYRVIENWN